MTLDNKIRFLLSFAILLYTRSGYGQLTVVHEATEYEVKAAFIYNFAKFIEWPENAFTDSTSPFVIGIVGSNPFGTILENIIQNKTVNGRKLVVKLFGSDDNFDKCHILFISSSEGKRLSQTLEALSGKNILTIGDMNRFTQSGGIIYLIMTDNKIHFEINVNAAEKAGLKLSSKLLNCAKVVRDSL